MEGFDKVEAVCFSNFVRVSPIKVSKILNQIRSRPYVESAIILNLLPDRSCFPILKALNSAVCNLKNKYQVDSSKIFIKEAKVNGGPIIRRFRPRAQGRAFPIKKKMSHIVSVS